MPHWRDRREQRPHDPARAGAVRSAQLVGWTAAGRRVYVCDVVCDGLGLRQMWRVEERFTAECPALARTAGVRP